MLHIVNGESTAGTLRGSSVSGDVFSIRDALIAGPTPAGVDGEEWLHVRAAHLADSYGIEVGTCEQDLLSQDEALLSFAQHDEVVLWFEHDLFCQLNLLSVLDWFATQNTGHSKLALINIGDFPGRKDFRGLGELNAEELASLFPGRHEVTSAELKLARSAWAAFRSSDPTAITRLLKTDTSSLPFLKTAFLAHLRRFPSTINGLGKIEQTSLEFVRDGFEQFKNLFPQFAAAERVYGLGDAQLWLALRELSTATQPLLSVENVNGALGSQMHQVIHQARFKLTDVGRAVLEGGADFLLLNERDFWLGGVHFQKNAKGWRWDEASGSLIFMADGA